MYNLKDVILDRISTHVYAADLLGDRDTNATLELVFILRRYDLITPAEANKILELYSEVLTGKQHYSFDCISNIVPYNNP